MSDETTSTDSSFSFSENDSSGKQISMFFNGLEFSKTRVSSLLFPSTLFCAVLITLLPSLHLCWNERVIGLDSLEYKNPACWTFAIALIFAFCSFMTVAISSYSLMLYLHTVNRFWSRRAQDSFWHLNLIFFFGMISLFIALIAKTVAALGLNHSFAWIIGIFILFALMSILFILRSFMTQDDPKYENGKTIADVISSHAKVLPSH
jgi:hypothetical protein